MIQIVLSNNVIIYLFILCTILVIALIGSAIIAISNFLMGIILFSSVFISMLLSLMVCDILRTLEEIKYKLDK